MYGERGENGLVLAATSEALKGRASRVFSCCVSWIKSAELHRLRVTFRVC